MINSKNNESESQSISSIILSGGRGTRIGGNKPQIMLLGKTLIEWTISSVENLSREILILPGGNPSQICHPKARFLPDLFPGTGPMGALYSGLFFCQQSWAFAFACDMPFVKTPLLLFMLKIRGQFDAVLGKINGQIQPFPGLYSRNCLPVFAEDIKNGRLKITRTLSSLNIQYFKEEDIKKYDPDMLSFFNVNSRDDLNQVISLLGEI
ncbi:MAG: molybdenum cofactor guanylyltransferase [Caldiserica bacterium]|jgi:molybdopterin-guanine dinucleotide biosynthesis protein A|nr:molybdenum cofactor guanylyltransferase [Caldisericota bacterium]